MLGTDDMTLTEQQKDDERARKAEIKHDEKVRKEEAKAIRAEQQHQHQHQQKPISENTPAPVPTTGQTEPPTTTTAEHKRLSSVGGRVRTLSLNFGKHRRKHSDEDTAPSPTTKVRTWLSSKFPRARNVTGDSTKSVGIGSGSGEGPVDEGKEGRLGNHQRDVSSGASFIGGVALARQKGAANSESSIPSVAAASDGNGKGVGKTGPETSDLSTTTTTPQAQPNTETTAPQPPLPPSTPPAKQRPPPSQPSLATESPTSTQQNHDHRSVSSLSGSSGGNGTNDVFVEARSEQGEENTPQKVGLGSGSMAVPLVGCRRRVSPVRESRFSEVFE